jgi:hypothetical protein
MNLRTDRLHLHRASRRSVLRSGTLYRITNPAGL